MNRFWCSLFADWLERNNMNCFFRYIASFYGTKNSPGPIQNRNWCRTSHATQTDIHCFRMHFIGGSRGDIGTPPSGPMFSGKIDQNNRLTWQPLGLAPCLGIPGSASAFNYPWSRLACAIDRKSWKSQFLGCQPHILPNFPKKYMESWALLNPSRV